MSRAQKLTVVFLAATLFGIAAMLAAPLEKHGGHDHAVAVEAADAHEPLPKYCGHSDQYIWPVDNYNYRGHSWHNGIHTHNVVVKHRSSGNYSQYYPRCGTRSFGHFDNWPNKQTMG